MVTYAGGAEPIVDEYERAFSLQYGQIVVPEWIATADYARAEALLATNDELIVMAAVQRLSSMDPKQCVPRLVALFKSIPYMVLATGAGDIQRSRVSPVKLEILRSLGRTHSTVGKEAIISIAREYWSNGPRKSAAWHEGSRRKDYEYARVLGVSATALSRWACDQDVRKFFGELVNDKELERRCGTELTTPIMALHLLGEIASVHTSSHDRIVAMFESSAVETNRLRRYGYDVLPLYYMPRNDIVGVAKEMEAREKSLRHRLSAQNDYNRANNTNCMDKKLIEDLNKTDMLSQDITRWLERSEGRLKQKGGAVYYPSGVAIVTGCFQRTTEDVRIDAPECYPSND